MYEAMLLIAGRYQPASDLKCLLDRDLVVAATTGMIMGTLKLCASEIMSHFA